MPLDTAGAVNAKEFNLNQLNDSLEGANAPGTPGQIRIDANYIMYVFKITLGKELNYQPFN